MMKNGSQRGDASQLIRFAGSLDRDHDRLIAVTGTRNGGIRNWRLNEGQIRAGEATSKCPAIEVWIATVSPARADVIKFRDGR